MNLFFWLPATPSTALGNTVDTFRRHARPQLKTSTRTYMNLFFVFLFLATRDTVGGPWRHRRHVLATCRPQLKTPLIICMNFFGPPATPLTALGDIVNMLPVPQHGRRPPPTLPTTYVMADMDLLIAEEA